MQVLFPERCLPAKYRDIHFSFIVESARAAGADVRISREVLATENGRFQVLVDGQEALFDFDDFPTVTTAEEQHEHVFKLHAQEGHPPSIHSFPVVCFYDWPRYRRLQQHIRYQGDADTIVCRQRPYAGAKTRRTEVQRKLRTHYGNWVKAAIKPQEEYWSEVSSCLTHVFVPGARNDMLDRGMLQWLAFGACVIAPPIRTLFPFGGSLKDGVHLIQCRPDYSDLIDRIEWCRANREACRAIGAAAKRLFLRTCTPKQTWKWVRQCLSGLES